MKLKYNYNIYIIILKLITHVYVSVYVCNYIVCMHACMCVYVKVCAYVSVCVVTDLPPFLLSIVSILLLEISFLLRIEKSLKI